MARFRQTTVSTINGRAVIRGHIWQRVAIASIIINVILITLMITGV